MNEVKLRAHTPRFVEKPWGDEVIWAEGSGYTAKLLRVKAGRRLSLQYHQVKHETLLLLEGEATILGLTMKPLHPVEIAPGVIHRIEAITDCVIVEASTPEGPPDDTVRLEDDFGRARTAPGS